MADETTAVEHTNAGLKWKKKKTFDGTMCGLGTCKRKPDGYIADIRPTKGHPEGVLWFGPACTKCVRKTHDSLNPLTLAELAYQRNGASDLALVLGVEVGDVKKRLKAAKIDGQGGDLVITAPNHPPSGERCKKHSEYYYADCPKCFPPETPAADQPAEAALANIDESTTVTIEAVAIPTKSLNEALTEAQGVLVFLGTFHVMDQSSMDNAASWLSDLKKKWADIEALRKLIAKPLRDKLQEVQDYFKPPQAVLLQAEGILKQKISDGNARAAEAQQAALAAAQQAHQTGDTAATALATQQAAAADVALPGNISTRSVIKFEITNTNLLPGNFWSPDRKLVQAAINVGHREIPGVRIWEEEVVTARKTG